MVATPKVFAVASDGELAHILDEAVEAPIILERDGERFRLVRESTAGVRSTADDEDPFANYDPERVTREVAERCAEIRAELTRRQRRVRPRALDLIAAATALEYGLTLVTRNTADYQDIPDVLLL